MKDNLEIKKTSLDKAINYIAPGWGAKRMQARLAMATASSYYGRVSRQRRMNEHRPKAGDANANTLRDLPRLRNDSSELIRTNPVAASAININKTHIVGPGITYHSRINRKALGMSEDEANEWQEKAQMEFRLATNTSDFSVDRKLNFADMTSLALGSYLERGDVFGLFVDKKYATTPYTTKLQLIEADRVCNDPKMSTRDTKNLIAGIEIEDDGTPVKIHLRTVHPGSDIGWVDRTWRHIPFFTKSGRRSVLHVNPITRIGQMRAVPYLAGVIGILPLLSDYSDAELQAAVTSACFTTFIETETGNTGLAPIEENDPPRDTTDKDYRLKPAALIELARGEKVTTANPGRPNSSYEQYVIAVLREVGAYLGIGRELLLIDFMKNFSASRAAMVTAYKRFNAERAFLVRHFCAVILERIIEEGVLRGRIIAPGFDDPLLRQAYLGARWIGPAQTQLDEVKASKAARDRIVSRTSTIADETAAIGGDFEQNVPQILKEEKLFGVPDTDINPAIDTDTDDDDNDDDKE